ncbi:hypothetical protein MYP_1848 [Sporocytophaga myxococcoides]|uniref:Secretion system C-terminal sorting domain-containing protein n=1 Tax=Sporocytophaga myxococcoides TaxID=153721 RepID=A0A098LCC2_9BACT|nr:3-coathanger stack domain-containing protein [Sporocytophaga myxococcoides]GAL84620.1 hypothetical protein MYP_1848 [Sporocytophaga myxococcoides]
MKNRYIYNKPFYLLVAVLTFQSFLSLGQVQNPYWYFPPYKVDFTTSTPTVSLIGTGALTKTEASNGIHNTAGDLSFYIMGNDIQGRTGQTGTLNFSPFLKEGLIIPIIGECNSYYVLGYDVVHGIKNGMDVTQYFLTYSKISVNPNGTWTSTPGDYIPIDDPSDASFAVSPYWYKKHGHDNYTYYSVLFLMDGSTHAIDDYDVSSSGITKSDFNLSDTRGGKANELEVTRNGGVAFGFENQPIIRIVKSENIYQDYSIPGLLDGGFSGIEFSRDGLSVFGAERITNKIYKFNLLDNSVSEVAGSSGLGLSQLELAYDGYIYASNGTQLKGFDPEAASPSITKTITVPNPISGGIYTLVDQNDRVDYSNPFNMPECLGWITLSGLNSANPIPSSNLWSEYFGYQKIKTLGSVVVNTGTSVLFVASGSIELNPGFEAEYGSTFEAFVEECWTPEVPDWVTCPPTNRIAEESFDVAVPSGLVLSPNPTSGVFSIQCNFDLTEDVYGMISNSRGESVMTITSGMFNGNMLNVNMEGYAKGLYYLNIKNGNDQYDKKVVIQ